MSAARDHWVYRHLGVGGKVLYVGVTNDRDRRLEQHRKSSPWADQIVDVAYEGPYSRAEGLKREAEAIFHNDPPNNMAHAPHYDEIKKRRAAARQAAIEAAYANRPPYPPVDEQAISSAMTVYEAAAAMSISARWVNGHIKTGRLRAFNVSPNQTPVYRITPDDLDAFMRSFPSAVSA